MLHPSCMGLAVQPWTPPHQVEIQELQVPHAYAEDESLWLAELWCEFIVQSISYPSPIYNPPTQICVIWSVHLGCLVHIPLYHNCSELVFCDRIGRSFLKWCGNLPSGTLPRRRAKEEKGDDDGNQNKCEEVCEPWNSLCTAKLKEVMQVGRDTFSGQTRQDTVEAQKGATFDQWLKPRQITVRPLLWEVCCDAYTRFKSSYNKTCFGVRQFKFNQDGWGPSRGSAECTFFAKQGVVIPFITYIHTLQHTNHPRCQSCLWVLRKSHTIEALVHSR